MEAYAIVNRGIHVVTGFLEERPPHACVRFMRGTLAKNVATDHGLLGRPTRLDPEVQQLTRFGRSDPKESEVFVPEASLGLRNRVASGPPGGHPNWYLMTLMEQSHVYRPLQRYGAVGHPGRA